jgi:hypothetical protein
MESHLSKHLPRRVTRATVVTLLAAVGVFATAQTALANWAQQSAPTPGTISDLSAVSCPASSNSFCATVGEYSDNAGTHMLAEFRNGNTWSAQTVPGPGGATLNDVNCPDTTLCIAVGTQPDGSGTATFAAIWNGSSWSDQTVPNPTSAATLNSVGCSSATECIAVGSSGSATLADAWNGSGWTQQTIPNGGGTSSNSLNGISCTVATFCMAVGAESSGANTQPIAELWDGSTWAIKTTPSPSGTFNPLNDVSCITSSACMAVGDGFAEHWNGSAWSVSTIAGSGGNTPADLTGVSCSGATTCSAVGSYFDSGAVQQGIVEIWSGNTWKVQNPPISSSFDSSGLSDLKCRTSSQCTAVGFYHDPTTGNRALVEVYAPRWQAEQVFSPTGAIAASLDQTSCPTFTFCEAVGGAEDSGSVFPAFAEQWNGGSWVIQSTPNANNTVLSGVSCTSTTNCVAVGDQVGPSSTLITLVESFDGTSWNTVSSPNPSGAIHSYLTSVSCTSSSACMATGFWTDGSGAEHTLAEQYNGSSWSVLTSPDPGSGTDPQLSSVSCASATSCIAAGNYLTPSYTLLAEHWNGSSWTVLTSTNPIGGTAGVFGGVSCNSASMCMAVGTYFNGSRETPMDTKWNGSSLTPADAAFPAGATSANLSDVACTGATGCIAVGSKNTPSGTFAFAEGWNGSSWSTQNVPPPVTNVARSVLSGVSCVSTTHCMGVGWYDDTSGNDAGMSDLYQ